MAAPIFNDTLTMVTQNGYQAIADGLIRSVSHGPVLLMALGGAAVFVVAVIYLMQRGRP